MPDDFVTDEDFEADELALGDAAWSASYIAALPDMAFAAIDGDRRMMPHHDKSVTKATENKSVDMAHLKSSMSACAKLEMPEDMRKSAKAHLKAHGKAMGMDPDTMTKMMGKDEEDAPNYQEQVEAVTSFVEAENLLLSMLESGVDEEMVAKAEAKLSQLASVDREYFLDDYEGVIEDVTQSEDGLWHFTARVAQADKVNKNKRLYPAEELAKNLPRVNRLAKVGKFTGRDGHGSMFGSDKVSEICVRYDAVMLQGGDLIMSGVLIPTQAGEDIAKLWANHVQTEWSIIGYGKQELVQTEGEDGYYKIVDYILVGCDPVPHGAANTRTLKVQKPKDGVEITPTVEAVETVVEAVAEPLPAEVPIMGEELETTKVEEAKAEPKAPEIDVAGIMAGIKADAAEATKTMVAEALSTAREQAKLDAAKDVAIAKLADGDELVVKVVSKFIEGCTSAEEIAAAVETATPIAEQMKKPKAVETSGNFFIHQDKERARFMWTGNKAVDRPTTIEGVKDALLDGLEDNGKQDWSNMRFIMEAILKNYEATRENMKYLHSMTQQGFPVYEAATTTGALGTTIPMVLPIIRSMLPQLIPYSIASVQPIDRPVARAYFYDPIYKTGTNGAGADGSNIDDSSVFDTAWPDHTEADTKSQISFTFTHTDVTAVEKAVYWDYTSTVMQDMQAYYNMDVEASMMAAGVDVLAQSINMTFLETLAAGAGQSGTFNTGLPASGFDDLSVWLSWGLSQSLNRASGSLAKKMGQPAGWIITGPTQATLFEASNSYSKLPAGAVNEFGTGLRQVGSWSNLYDVYVADWAETLTSLKNKMLIGYRPRNWDRSAAVFCPYVPLYVSPTDSVPSTNTMSHSVSSRNAYKVLQANGLYLLTIGSAAGSALTYTD